MIIDLLKRVWMQVKSPVNQSLVLMLGTVFVLGSQFALWQAQSDVQMTGSYVTLLSLYLLKNANILYREIKETPNHDGNVTSTDSAV
jgi:hypothetical protein